MLAVLANRRFSATAGRPSLVKWSVLKECSGFSAMAPVSNLAASLINATDSIVIGLMSVGSEAIVPYYIALRLTQFIRQPIEKAATLHADGGALAAIRNPAGF